MARKPKVPELAKKDRGSLTVDERYYDDADIEKYRGISKDELQAKISQFQDAIVARAVSQPETRAARTIQRLEGDLIEINVLADELRAQVKAVSGGNLGRAESMLVAQAHVLDMLFSQMVMRAHGNMGAGHLQASEIYMRLALRAQSQAVRTIEALGELKNPRPVAFVKQANIAQNQQVVNNEGTPSRAWETESAQSKLLEAQNGERLDTGAQSKAIGANPAMATLVEVDRAKVRGG
jgi:hypothetical protein